VGIIDPRTWPVVKGGEPLTLYPLRPGVSIKLTLAQARQRGYLPADTDDEAKRRAPADTKKRAPAANKKRAPAPNKAPVAEDEER